MIDEREIVRVAVERLAPPEPSYERLVQRRDRKRRNQRIAAGVVGIAVFVGLIWILTSGLSFDPTETPAGPGPAETAPPRAPASAAPAIVVRTGTCSGSATWRLEFAPGGDRFKVRFEVHRSPVGHSWRIVLGHTRTNSSFPGDDVVFFRGTRVAAEDGEVVVQGRVWNTPRRDGVAAKATDRQTGQACKMQEEIW
jgi:hypothetical protein